MKVKILEDLLKPIFEMANIRKTTTGLPVNIWVSPKYEGKNLRIKVSSSYSNNIDPRKTFSLNFDKGGVSLRGDIGEIKSSDISLIKNYFIKNKEIFMKFWNMEIDDDELKELLKKVK